MNFYPSSHVGQLSGGEVVEENVYARQVPEDNQSMQSIQLEFVERGAEDSADPQERPDNAAGDSTAL